MNNENDGKKFTVHISDEDYFDNSVYSGTPSRHPEPRKKFVVNIDENANRHAVEEQPKYNGEVYFANPGRTKPRTAQPQPPVPSQNVTPPEKPKKKKKINLTGKMCLCFVLVITVILSLIGISCINDILAISRSEDIVTINIPADASTNEIIDILADNGLVRQKAFCKLFYTAFNYVKNINKKTPAAEPVYLSGVYYVQKNMGLEGFLTEFKEIQKSNDTVTLTFQEGWSVYQVFERLDKFGVCSKDKLLASLKNADFKDAISVDINGKANRTFELEGYLFPETYEFFEDSDPNSVIRKFLDEYNNRWTEEYQKRADELGLTQDEVMIIASIIQREAADGEQMPLISSVLHNRLAHPVSWPTLGCDSTENYITNYIAPNCDESEALIFARSYNTYTNQGLPPGPICNPGEKAIKAALYPESTNYYFFRHDKYGKIYMATTQSEHDANGNLVLRANSH